MDEDDDKAVLSQLGGFALEQFLGSFVGEDIDASSLTAIGLGGGAVGSASTSRGAAVNGNAVAAVDSSQIYSGRYEDEGEDWEDEVDRELNEEDNGSKNNNQMMMLQLPSASTSMQPSTQTTLMRGEDEDFDDDDDDDEDNDNDDNMHAAPSTNNLALPMPASFHLPDASEIMHVKQEEQDLDNGLHGHAPMQESMHDNDYEQDEEEEKIDPKELAAQQALFAQSYARMQAQQQQAGGEEQPGQTDMVSDIRAASPQRVMDVRSLYPSFAPDKVLNFTDLFHPRPRKRTRIDPNIEVCRLQEHVCRSMYI
jgi:hypothetical protein